MLFHSVFITELSFTPLVCTREIPLPLVHNLDMLLQVTLLCKRQLASRLCTQVRPLVGVSPSVRHQ